MVAQSTLVTALTDIGLSAGDMVMVHSSLSSFGHVEGGAPTVVAALLEVLTEAGTLVAPTFSKYLSEDSVWDREYTPSLMGKISETIRTWSGALRSSHAAHPLAAIGAKAELICRRPYRTGFGPDSPFKTLVDENAWILLMGVPYSNCTLFHLLEAEAQVPYRFLEERKAVTIIDGVRDEDGSAWEYTRLPDVSNDFLTFGGELESRGLVRRCTIGNSDQRLFRAKDVYEVGMKFMARNPLYLLSAESQERWRRQ
ncbi:MAG: AAC(3) family N-acetyltransferase [Armatimonadia bacterium]